MNEFGKIVAAWFGVGYFLLAVTTLFSFIRHLKKISTTVQSEKSLSGPDPVTLTASKIQFWSTIGISSTFLNFVLLELSEHFSEAISITLALDACLNSFLVVVMAEKSTMTKWV